MGDQPKEIFIKNKYRELQSKLNSQREGYQPEYERLNKQPQVHEVQEDFRYSGRRPPQMKKPSPQMAIASGHNDDASWIPKNPSSDASDTEVIAYDDVPDPPKNIMADFSSGPAVSIDSIPDGHYFVVVMDTIVAESEDLGEIEEFVDRLIFDTSLSVGPSDIIVLRKLKIKVGVSIG